MRFLILYEDGSCEEMEADTKHPFFFMQELKSYKEVREVR